MNATQNWPDGWRGHEQQQRERESRWTFDEKLQWLEDAHKMVLQLQQHTSSTRSEDDDKESTSQ